MLSREQFDKEIQSITEQLVRLYKPEKIILFGSLARGKGHNAKDIDLFIVKKDPPDVGTERIRELDQLIKYKIATDFIVYTPQEVKKRIELGDPFTKSIFKEGKVLYDAG